MMVIRLITRMVIRLTYDGILEMLLVPMPTGNITQRSIVISDTCLCAAARCPCRCLLNSSRSVPSFFEIKTNKIKTQQYNPGKLFSWRDSTTGLSHKGGSPPTMRLPNDSGGDSV